MGKKVSLAFLFSNWFSGATLLAILLNNQDDISCHGEAFPFSAKGIDIHPCSCGRLLLECEYFRTTRSHMLDKNGTEWNRELFAVLPRFSKNSLLNRWLCGFRHFHQLRDWLLSKIPTYSAKVDNFVQAHSKYIRTTCIIDRSTVFVDGTKDFRRAELLIRGSGMRSVILYLIRDGRGFCLSYKKHYRLARRDLPKAARAWLEHISLVDLFAERYPATKCLTIRYEDLCRNPLDTMAKALRFLGLDPPGTDEFDAAKEYHVLGNRMRKDFDGTIVEDLKWQTELSSSEKAVVTDIMRSGLIRFGYL